MLGLMFYKFLSDNGEKIRIGHAHGMADFFVAEIGRIEFYPSYLRS